MEQARRRSKLKNENNSFWQKGRVDISFLALVSVLLTTGLLMLFSASYAYALANEGNSYHFIIRQLIFAVAGFVVMLFVSKINYRFWRKFVWVLYGITVVLLSALLILPPMVPGATQKRWFVIGPISFQPSEIAKFAIILVFAHLISKNYKKMGTLKFGILTLGLFLGVVSALVVFETHISATIIIFCIGIAMMIIGGCKLRYIFIGAGGAIALVSVVVFISGYGISRITNWFDPWANPVGEGYQTIQSLLAIGSGGIFGRGFGQSRQKYLWVPEPQNDFIFSIVCEELGLIGALVIVLLFCALVWRGFQIAMKAPDKFGSLLSVGITFQVGVQSMLNFFVVTNTLPNTGISLPFFSYGGTALLILLFEMGIVLSVSRSSNMEKG